MLKLTPIEVQEQPGVLNIISVSFELNTTKNVSPPESPVLIPVVKETVIKPVAKKEPLINNPGKYWGKSITDKGDTKQPAINNGKGKVIRNTGNLPNVITSKNGKVSIPLPPDKAGNGNGRYGNNSTSSGESISAAKPGNSGTFYTNFSKNEEDFLLKFQITVLNGKISKVKQISINRTDNKDDMIREAILSGEVKVNPNCESDKMNIIVTVTDGNRCNYVWE
jgi:hypothetical protein